MSTPDLITLTRIEERILAARLEAVRATITHGGEKGRSLEQTALALLRDILPAEYGLSTGFIAHRTTSGIGLSTQLDVIVYDAVRTGPLARLQSCDVFPLEAVYGYIEVKATIQSSSDLANKWANNSIEHCLEQSKALRAMDQRWFYTQSSPTGAGRARLPHVSLRSYVLAFAAEGAVATEPPVFAQRMANFSRQLGDPTHLSGVFVANTGYYRTRPFDEAKDKPNLKFAVDFVTDNGLSVFKTSLIHDLARYPRFPSDWSPALHEYYVDTDWTTLVPI